MIFAVMFVGFAVVSSTVKAAECDLGTVTLMKGSTGTAVTCLQTKLGVTPVTGYFGSITDGKVKAFQTANSLLADGKVGALTKAALGLTTTTTTLPAGCTAGALFSSTTGAPCTATTTSTTLSGGAGSIDVNQTSSDVEDVAIEGQATKMLGFKVEASDSDIAITNLKLKLENKDAPDSPYRLTNYVDSVDIYMGSTKVGSADASDFSKSSYAYTKSINLSNAVVKMGSTHIATFYVVINAASSIDTANMDGGANPARFEIDVNSIRYQDATGLVMSEGDDSNPLVTVAAPAVAGSFDSLTNSGDVKLTISKGSGNPAIQNVTISDTGSTPDVKMLEFKLKATGADLSFDQLTVAIDSTVGAGDNSDMILDMSLKNGSDVLASDPTIPAGDGNVTFNLDDTFTIAADSTETFIVYAKIAELNAFTSGDLKVSLAQSGIATEDENGDTVTNESGAASGNVQTFTSSSATVSGVSTSGNVANNTTKPGYISFAFTVSADEGDVVLDATPNNAGNLTWTITGTDTTLAGLSAPVLSKTSGDATLAGGNYTVYEGDTATFVLDFTFTTVDAGDNGTYRITLNKVAGVTLDKLSPAVQIAN